MFRLQPVRKYPVNTFRGNVFGDLDQLFEDFFEGPSYVPMKVDILDQEKAYVVEAELPGFAKEDIQVELKDDYLTIRVEKKDSKEENGKNYLRRERSQVSYQRSFYIENIEAEGIEASFDQGILTLTLPKKEVVVNAAKRIDIK